MHVAQGTDLHIIATVVVAALTEETVLYDMVNVKLVEDRIGILVGSISILCGII